VNSRLSSAERFIGFEVAAVTLSCGCLILFRESFRKRESNVAYFFCIDHSDGKELTVVCAHNSSKSKMSSSRLTLIWFTLSLGVVKEESTCWKSQQTTEQGRFAEDIEKTFISATLAFESSEAHSDQTSTTSTNHMSKLQLVTSTCSARITRRTGTQKHQEVAEDVIKQIFNTEKSFHHHFFELA